jgi:ribosomal protein S18 acetylase RimI-like enzyme
MEESGAGGVVIRPMTVLDFGQVYNLGVASYDILDKPYNWWSIPEVADHLGNHPNLCYVAVIGERVVGFALGASDFELIEEAGHLEWVAVDKDYRGHGIASRLIRELLRCYQEMGKSQVVTDIASDNPASRGMARKLGFTEGITVAFFVKEL